MRWKICEVNKMKVVVDIPDKFKEYFEKYSLELSDIKKLLRNSVIRYILDREMREVQQLKDEEKERAISSKINEIVGLLK